MISVCIATYNGGKYIKEQLDSILPQLGTEDEIVVSDDSSTDNTLDILFSYADSRIKVYPNQHFHSPVFNFESALIRAKGDYIFLSDQDDIWESNKVQVMLDALKRATLVVSDCSVIDKNMELIKETFFQNKVRKKGVISNIICNNYLGCCMAFRREVLYKALPFPKNIAMHDIWLGLCASAFYSVEFISDKLIKYRRHGDNASPTGETSHLKISYRIIYRIQFVVALIRRMFPLSIYGKNLYVNK